MAMSVPHFFFKFAAVTVESTSTVLVRASPLLSSVSTKFLTLSEVLLKLFLIARPGRRLSVNLSYYVT